MNDTAERQFNPQPQHLDSNRRRWADAYRPWLAARRRFAYARVYHHGFSLPRAWCPGGLYCPKTAALARALVARAFAGVPAYWKLEEGRGGRLHVHVLAPMPWPLLALPRAWRVREPVSELRRALAYLVKPADALLCRPPRRTWRNFYRWPTDGAARLAHMVLRYAALDKRGAAVAARRAAGKSRLAPLRGFTGPKPQQQPLSLHMVAALRLLWMLARTAQRGAALAAQQQRPRPGPMSTMVDTRPRPHSRATAPLQAAPCPAGPGAACWPAAGLLRPRRELARCLSGL